MFQTVFIGSKPSVCREFAPYLLHRFAETGEPVLSLSLCHLGHHRFDFPRGVPYRDYPLVTVPSYRRDTPRFLPAEAVMDDRGDFLSKPSVRWNPLPNMGFHDVSAVIGKAGRIACILDDHHTEVKACQLLLDDVAPGWSRDMRFLWGSAAALDRSSLTRLFTEGLSAGRMPENLWRNKLAGDAKHFLDYNFAANSMAVLGKTAKDSGLELADGHLSKYQVMTLYLLRSLGPVSDGELIAAMESFPGSGKHDPVGIGSPTSRLHILSGLETVGASGRTAGGHIVLSPEGAAFLNRLHPDCFDPDLPARIAFWMTTGRDAVAPMSRYLRTWFARQKRFMAGLPVHAPVSPEVPGGVIRLSVRAKVGEEAMVERTKPEKPFLRMCRDNIMVPVVSVVRGGVTGNILCQKDCVREAASILSDELAAKNARMSEEIGKARDALALVLPERYDKGRP